jgi:hypothetical protein
MADTALSCAECRAIFRDKNSLKNHIKGMHQQEVKARFPRDVVRAIKRDVDGTFKCICGKRFTVPNSVRRHAKLCTGDGTGVDLAESVEQDARVTEDEQRLEEEGEGDTMIDLSYECTGIDSLELWLICFRR